MSKSDTSSSPDISLGSNNQTYFLQYFCRKNRHKGLYLPYVITTRGDIIDGRRNGTGKKGLPTPHPTLIGGKDPKVAMAGMLHIHGGKIASYDTNSGHFKPNVKSMPVADAAFKKLAPNLFKKSEVTNYGKKY